MKSHPLNPFETFTIQTLSPQPKKTLISSISKQRFRTRNGNLDTYYQTTGNRSFSIDYTGMNLNQTMQGGDHVSLEPIIKIKKKHHVKLPSMVSNIKI